MTLHPKWNPSTLWQDTLLCTWIRLTQYITANPINGAWNWLVLADIPLPDTLKNTMVWKLGNNTAISMLKINRPNITRLANSNPPHRV